MPAFRLLWLLEWRALGGQAAEADVALGLLMGVHLAATRAHWLLTSTTSSGTDQVLAAVEQAVEPSPKVTSGLSGPPSSQEERTRC
ncbi:hypothetical protein ACFQ6Q_37525 [Streptomyces sp. NPDC056437]|uniref:hypothetical protein n=1 Tax=Streptomyces sp. NPDC056437 TaxID=3345816 RepID=UPI0036AEF5C1